VFARDFLEKTEGGETFEIHALAMNYVSCSPLWVPIARLAAAQASLEG